jgi:NAD(P)-dependent dehydrogenase (short-subunit alcohol dehydrogenase family)
MPEHPTGLDPTRHVGQVAIVTGAASGIGRATATRLAREGATVVATDVDAERLGSLGAGIAEGGHECHAVPADVSVEDDVTRVVDAALAIGPVHLLANVAGIGDGMLPVGDVDDDTWDTVLAVNLSGPMRLCRRVVPLMKQRCAGAVVNISSVAGLGGGAGGAAYTASKHAIIGLTRSIAYLYGPDGVRCNAVCPGGVKTRIERTARPRVPWAWDRLQAAMARNPGFVEADRIAAVISWLASDDASFVNGAVVNADGGWMAA